MKNNIQNSHRGNLKLFFLIFFLKLSIFNSFGQLVPSPESNIDYVVTFSKDAPKTYGDDDYSQVYFFAIPAEQMNAVFFRIFDPEISGTNDQMLGTYNSTTVFSLYGGKNAYSSPDARNVNPTGNYKQGLLLDSKKFESEKQYDNNWYTFGPFNPKQGEYDSELDSYVFKLIAEGVKGDDGNMYRYFLSSSPKENNAIEGGNAFAYELCFRITKKPGKSAHFYPFINSNISAITFQNFDFDNDGDILVTSVAKKNHTLLKSQDGNWESGVKEIVKDELNTSLDIHIVKKSERKNDMVIYLTNQYKQAIPFFSAPIGGLPRYKYKIDISKSLTK